MEAKKAAGCCRRVSELISCSSREDPVELQRMEEERGRFTKLQNKKESTEEEEEEEEEELWNQRKRPNEYIRGKIK